MTRPEKLSIGNVSFYKNDIKSYEVKHQGNTNFNTVFMKDGTKITFFDQKAEDNPSIMMGIDGTVNGSKKGIKFSNVSLHSLTGTDKEDYYYMSHSDVYSIDLGGDKGNGDELKFVYNNDTRKSLSSPRYVNKDADDKIIDVNLSKQKIINMNEGFFFRPTTEYDN